MNDTAVGSVFKVGDLVKCGKTIAGEMYFEGWKTIKRINMHGNYPIVLDNGQYYKSEELLPFDESEKTNKAVVAGVGSDAPMVVNELGGKQSKVNYRFDLFEPNALFEMCKVLDEGAKKYGDWNWFKIDTNDHLNHALIHIYAYLAGDKQDDHLAHAAVRAQFALSTYLKSKQESE